MKRHSSLVSLSREHHEALILSRLLQKDAPLYKGMPTDIQGKALYAVQFYNDHLVAHFKDEEKVLEMATGINNKLDFLIQNIIREHQDLHKMFSEIKSNPDMPTHLDTLGKELEAHIRKEERELFPLIQETCSEEVLDSIGRYFLQH